jgi:DNA-directed RNA polymerase alpha subunit
MPPHTAELQEITAKCAEIDAREDLTREQKIVAKRAAGMSLRAIGKQSGISTERVRQIIKAIEQKDSLPFAELGLPTRTKNALRNGGITTIDALCWLTEAELCRLPGLGPKGRKELIQALAKIGRELSPG